MLAHEIAVTDRRAVGKQMLRLLVQALDLHVDQHVFAAVEFAQPGVRERLRIELFAKRARLQPKENEHRLAGLPGQRHPLFVAHERPAVGRSGLRRAEPRQHRKHEGDH